MKAPVYAKYSKTSIHCKIVKKLGQDIGFAAMLKAQLANFPLVNLVPKYHKFTFHSLHNKYNSYLIFIKMR